MNMAIDEALLGVVTQPVLRVYRWVRAAVSFGYFESWGAVRGTYPERDAVRRWTGGGVVLHGEDFTYSLLIPGAGERMRAGESYREIHNALCRGLGDAGIVAEAAGAGLGGGSGACFENPVLYDVLVEGRKVAGAAQRRTRAGLLHQGSVQGVKVPGDFGLRFAEYLAGEVGRAAFDVVGVAEELARVKYGTRGWMERRA
jgi:lipoate-protein ligase A